MVYADTWPNAINPNENFSPERIFKPQLECDINDDNFVYWVSAGHADNLMLDVDIGCQFYASTIVLRNAVNRQFSNS